MAKCPYCESKLILINTFNCEDVYNEEGYETHWYCENEECEAWIVGKVKDSEVV